jgi:hypothetical protein
MSNKLYSRSWFVVTALLGIVLLVTAPQPAVSQAQVSTEEPACLHCHEDLYYLHDTGKWFCISESPMRCVGCHGGDPAAHTKEAAHLNRTAHPIINGDTTTCRQCHVENCAERVSKFDAIAGISPVILRSTPVLPAPVASTVVQPVSQAAREVTPVWDWPVLFALIILVLGLALIGWRRSHSN